MNAHAQCSDVENFKHLISMLKISLSKYLLVVFELGWLPQAPTHLLTHCTFLTGLGEHIK